MSAQAGDVLVAYAGSEDTSATVSISGGGLTWTLRQSVVVSGYANVYVWTATASSTATVTITFTDNGSVGHFGGALSQWRGSAGIGASAKANTSGAPSLGITTMQANSALVTFAADWNALSGISRAYNSSAGPTTERSYAFESGRYTVYGWTQANVGAAGARTVGLTAPTGQKYSIVSVEVKGT